MVPVLSKESGNYMKFNCYTTANTTATQPLAQHDDDDEKRPLGLRRAGPQPKSRAHNDAGIWLRDGTGEGFPFRSPIMSLEISLEPGAARKGGGRL